MKIVFFATPEYTNTVLEALTNAGHEIVSMVAKKDDLVFEEFQKMNPEICVIAAYGKIIPKKYLAVPRYGFVNIHPSLLPKYRGPSPIKTAILNGDTETGVTIMILDAEMDHGPILAQAPYSIRHTTYHSEMQKELWELGAKLLINTLSKYISYEVQPRKQDHSQATFTKKLTREDGHINWSQPAEKIYNQIRALSDEPGAWTTWNGKVLNIKSAETYTKMPFVIQRASLYTGTVIRVDGQVAVATGKCYLILKTIQLEGRKDTDAKSFVNGHSDFINSKLR